MSKEPSKQELKQWTNEQKQNYNPRGAKFSKGMMRLPELWRMWKLTLKDDKYSETLADPNLLGVFDDSDDDSSDDDDNDAGFKSEWYCDVHEDTILLHDGDGGFHCQECGNESDKENVYVEECEIEGKIYLKDSNNIIYDPKTEDELGKYDFVQLKWILVKPQVTA